MKKCICHSPLLKAHKPRYPTADEKAHLRQCRLHQIARDPHHPTRDEVEKVNHRLEQCLIVVYDSPIPDAPPIMNVFWDWSNLHWRHTFLCYNNFIVPIPELDLDLMVAMEEQPVDENEPPDMRDRMQIVHDVFHEYVREGEGYFAH